MNIFDAIMRRVLVGRAAGQAIEEPTGGFLDQEVIWIEWDQIVLALRIDDALVDPARNIDLHGGHISIRCSAQNLVLAE